MSVIGLLGTGFGSGGGGGGSPPTRPVLAIVDNGNGTATATISGGDSGVSNTIKTCPVFGSTWTTSATRTGNGTATLTLSAGPYYAIVEADNGDGLMTSLPVVFRVTNGDQSIHYQCELAVQQTIQALALTDIDSANVLVRKFPYEREIPLPLPGVLISFTGSESQPKSAGTNVRDDIGYPVLVTMLAKDNQDLTANHNRNLLWRERINKAFRNQGLAGVDQVWDCTVEPQTIASAAGFLKNVWAGALLLRFINREERGIT